MAHSNKYLQEPMIVKDNVNDSQRIAMYQRIKGISRIQTIPILFIVSQH